MKKIIIAGLAVSALALLSACTTPTPYQPVAGTSAYHVGYSDTRIEDGRYRISFAGNDATTRETVENYMLYHAAELTLNSGYDWFEIVKRATDSTTRTTTYDDPIAYRFYGRGRWGAWGFGDNWNSDSFEYTRYEASAEILMHKGAKPEGQADAYDARSVKQNLEPKVVHPTAK